MRWLACITFIGLAATSPLHAQSGADRVFERLDQDGNGVLDRDEFQRAPVNQRNPNLFDQLDTDADGVVSREEAARARAVMQEVAVEAAVAGKAGTKTLRWEIDGEERTALIRIPERAEGERAPLVFVWHGHGGRSTGAARTFGMHEHWPEAIVIHPQGLPTPGKLTDPEGRRSGWQTKEPAADNRDLRFFDVMYEDLLKQGIVDPELVYSTGHSNGGGFTYTLLLERGDRLAAIAPSSSAGSRNRGRTFPKIPIFHLAGREDGLVKMQWQQATIDHLRRLYDCGDPKPWGDHPDCRVHPSPEGDFLVTYVHGGGHKMPDDAGALFARFFRDHARSVRAEREKHIDATNLEPGSFGDQAQSSPR
jgi:polyhydroxybutyrate depolymerase